METKNIGGIEKLLTVEEVAEIIGISPFSLRRNIYAFPDRCPQFLRTAHGSNGHLRFRPEKVREWLENMEKTAVRHRTPGSPAAERCGKNRRGRPTKAESLAREMAASNG